ncbi:BON domain-containing protein [Thaumasiovibrio sp. DFM-14]|uniref:BON domain-containing protein n=1 Tax=Thaumasiovibrio sp. DFM-14 TaxID=3384792 RepID=UPI0039A1F779
MIKIAQHLIVALLILLTAGCSTQRGLSSQWKDKQIEMNVAGLVNKPPYQNALRVSVIAYNGEVLLAGQTNDTSLKRQFIDDVRAMSDVERVYDQLRIGSLADINSVSRDTWITGRLKTALLADSSINNGTIKLMTEAQEVFLMGTLPKTQISLATNKAREIDGVKEVFTIIYPE